MTMRGELKHILLFFVLFAVVVAPLFFPAPINYLRTLIDGNTFTSACIYIILHIIGTVAAPIATLPLVPIAAVFFGPFYTALYSIFAWSVGAAIAFKLARHVGRPVLSRFVDLDAVWRFESWAPRGAHFTTVLLLRMMLPVDVLSYLLGFVSTISFRVYMSATVLGIAPFAFIYSYLGIALFGRSVAQLIFLSAGAVVLFAVAYFSYRHTMRIHGQNTES